MNIVISLIETFSYDEMSIAILNIGRGIGIDGLDENIARLFPKGVRDSLTQFWNTVFRLSYPKNWTYQILRPEVKRGHTLEKPKLRGIAVSSMLPTVYDIMLDNRFKIWYKINREQTGFREGQGCLVQILAIYLLHGETIYIGYIDYEKGL